MSLRSVTIALSIVLYMPLAAPAQFKEREEPKGTGLGDSITQRWKAGLEFTAGAGGCRNVLGTAPVPTDWPEQRVRVIEEDTTPGTRLTYRNLPPGVRQMVITNPFVRPGRSFKSLITLEIERFEQIPPEDTTIFQLAKGRDIPRSVRQFLAPSPYIESTQPRFRLLFNEITSEPETAWEKIAAVYDWVRDNVEYKDTKTTIKGAVAAIRDGNGDCEDLTALFIAICRAGGVPARTVWVQGHCYPEFFLVDDEGKGHWFPCQVAGTYAFGGMPDLRIILQKGDAVRMPENPRDIKRYASEHLSGVGQVARHRFVRELISE